MQRLSFLATGVLTLGLLTSLPAFAASGTLPPEHTQGTVTYRCGGVGAEEARAFAAAAGQYPLTLEFVIHHIPRAELADDIHITIADTHGQHLLDTRSAGPFLLVKLPAGRYTVTAERQGQTLTRTVRVATQKPAHVMFRWTA